MPHDTAIPILGQRPPAARHPLSGPGPGPCLPPRSLYLHVPFCFHKCHYCDFYSIVDTMDRQQAFTDRLRRELTALAPAAGPLSTIFVGGGTPSLLRPDLWRGLLADLNRLFDLSEVHAGRGEFTVECNPETVTPELMDTLRSGGVDRVSVGAQSFHAAHLKTLERWHDPANVARSLGMARAAGIGRQSIDLIFGIPGQTVAEWEQDLATALSLGTEHLSCYNLTYEPNTAMTKRLELGQFSPAEEDAEVAMFHATLRAVRAAGMDRYEVSNFARPGRESRHNLAYWRQEGWLAAGPSASGYVRSATGPGGWRWKNIPRLGDYLEPMADGLPPVTDVEGPDAKRALVETILMGVRLTEGLDAQALTAAADALKPGGGVALTAAAARLASEGSLTVGDRWALTDAGWLITNRVVLELVEALD